MALTPSVLAVFARESTRRQVSILRDVGLETEVTDRLMGHLAGRFPERYAALSLALGRQEGMPRSEQLALMAGVA